MEQQRGQRGGTHRREHPGRQAAERLRRQRGHERTSQASCDAAATRVGRRHHALPNRFIQMVSDAAATKGPNRKNRGQGIRGICAGRYHHCSHHHNGMAAIAPEKIPWALRLAQRRFRARDKLSVCTWTGNSCCDNGQEMARAAKSGILFKTAASLEATGRTQIVALDKTGTITSGEPKVTDIVPDETFFEEIGKHAGECQCKADDLNPYSSTDKALWSRKLLAIAASVEAKSEHPLCKSHYGAR